MAEWPGRRNGIDRLDGGRRARAARQERPPRPRVGSRRRRRPRGDRLVRRARRRTTRRGVGGVRRARRPQCGRVGARRRDARRARASARLSAPRSRSRRSVAGSHPARSATAAWSSTAWRSRVARHRDTVAVPARDGERVVVAMVRTEAVGRHRSTACRRSSAISRLPRRRRAAGHHRDPRTHSLGRRTDRRSAGARHRARGRRPRDAAASRASTRWRGCSSADRSPSSRPSATAWPRPTSRSSRPTPRSCPRGTRRIRSPRCSRSHSPAAAPPSRPRHCQQVLAGIGFTAEHALHRYIKRALVLDGVLGSSSRLPRELGTTILATRQLPRLLDL